MVAIAMMAMLILSWWWVSAPRELLVPPEARATMQACVEVDALYVGKGSYTKRELDAMQDAIDRCFAEEDAYFQENGRPNLLLQLPAALTRQ